MENDVIRIGVSLECRSENGTQGICNPTLYWRLVTQHSIAHTGTGVVIFDLTCDLAGVWSAIK